jgi:hypothetical protein
MTDEMLMNRVIGINGRFAPKVSHTPEPIRPTKPIMIGTKVLQLDHGNWFPPQVIPTKKAQRLEINRKPPIQSTRARRSKILGRSAVSRTVKGTNKRPIAQNGRLM